MNGDIGVNTSNDTTTTQEELDVRGRIPIWAIFAFIALLWFYATRDNNCRRRR